MTKQTLRMVLDAAMTLLMVLEMAFLATGTAFHEYAGMVLLVLFLAHQVLNAGWYKGLARGKWPPLRIIMTVLNAALLALMLIEAVTGAMLSQVIFKGLALPDGGLLARQLHSAAAYWGLLLIGVHLGLHWAGIWTALHKKLHLQPNKVRTLLCRVLAAALVLLALREWVAKEVWAKLTMYYAYSFYDPTSNAVLYTLGFFALLAASAVLGHYAVQLYRAIKKNNQNNQNNQK